MTITTRLQRLEQRLAPREPAIAIEQWCGPDGQPCDPPEIVRRRVEEDAAGCWRCAAWAPESGCVGLLGENDRLRVVEL